jgi:DNA-binding response OmpR family regulator
MKTNRILIVEDDRVIAMYWKEILEKMDYCVTAIAATGISALEELSKTKPDLILMDILLKGDMDGIVTAKKMRARYYCPIIFITENDDVDGKMFESAKEASPQSYITKPFEDRTLLHTVQLVLQNSENGMRNRNTKIVEGINDGIFIVPTGTYSKVKLLFQDILFIKASKAWSEIYYESNGTIANKPHKVSLSSNHVFQQLAFEKIIKVHRSYYVNLTKVNCFENSSIYIHGVKIPVSNRFIKTIKNALRSFEHNLFKK